tara:strand:+ start:48 stop:407 length:360 start_codon:yes stop_codon:yes gene_type:complete
MKNIVKSFIILFFTSQVMSADFENLQLLEFDSNSELNKYMRNLKTALGVKCSYCHDMENKALDNPHKEITREMIILTRTINRHLLSLKDDDEKDTVELVTCWTCHKGNTKVEYNKPEDD